jgi:hypothetical protein
MFSGANFIQDPLERELGSQFQQKKHFLLVAVCPNRKRGSSLDHGKKVFVETIDI